MIARLIFALFVAASLQAAAFADSQEDAFKDSLPAQFHYVLYVSAHRLNYLNYAGSTLNPIDRLSVTFQATSAAADLRNITSTVSGPVKYEDFWYHQDRAFGLDRFCKTPVPANEEGAIFITPNPNDAATQNTAAAASCAVRLFLEANLIKSYVAAVIVPDQSLDAFVNALAKYKFYSFDSPGSGGAGTQLTMRILTYPSSEEHYLYHQL
jgi:hypothetical protein